MRHIRLGLITLAVIGSCWVIGEAGAQQVSDDAKKCVDDSLPPDPAIQACTRAIDSKQIPAGRALAELYYHRGNAWSVKDNLDKAIADYDAATQSDKTYVPAFVGLARAWLFKGDTDKAMANLNTSVSLDPRDPGKFYVRSRIWLIKGEPNKAVADLDAAIRIRPDMAPAYGARGRAKFYRGQFPEAIADLKQYADRDPSPYTFLWSYLAKTRANQDGKADLDQAATMVQPTQWPGPLVRAFQGQLDRAGVLAAIAKANANARNDQTCEAEFYLGELAQSLGKSDEAEKSFNRAIEICPKNFIEYEGAVAELKSLKK
ncbi:MAG: tetratricopeptide repeat protein [Alphaproteobacteria bacterium]